MTTSIFAPAIYVRFDGCSRRLNAAQLGLAANSGDRDIKTAVAQILEVSHSQLRFHIVERHENGDISVRPDEEEG